MQTQADLLYWQTSFVLKRAIFETGFIISRKQMAGSALFINDLTLPAKPIFSSSVQTVFSNISLRLEARTDSHKSVNVQFLWLWEKIDMVLGFCWVQN